MENRLERTSSNKQSIVERMRPIKPITPSIDYLTCVESVVLSGMEDHLIVHPERRNGRKRVQRGTIVFPKKRRS